MVITEWMLAKYLYTYSCKGLKPILKLVAHFHSMLGFWGWLCICITNDPPSPGLQIEIGQAIAVLPLLALASRCLYIVMLSLVICKDISPKYLGFPWLPSSSSQILSSIPAMLLLRGDEVIAGCSQMKSIWMFVALCFNFFVGLKRFKIKSWGE